jgi:Na+/H+ antiporter NhaD/arsenite permease-like protein
MHAANATPTPVSQTLAKIASVAGLTLFLSWASRKLDIATTTEQSVAIATFMITICTTLFFWTHRVAVAFLGLAVLIGTKAMTLTEVLHHTELNIIFFLIGMMIIIGALKDLGFLTWIIQTIINKKKMTGATFTVILCCLSAVLSSVVGEVSSIVVVMALVFQVCDTLKINPIPFVMISVLCTNIGSAATMLGNPVGVFIGSKAGLTFGQFLVGATPVALVCAVATLLFILLWYRKNINEMSLKMEERRKMNRGLGPLVRLPYRRGIFVLTATVVTIAFHHQIETALGLTGPDTQNAFLIMTPLIVSALLMIYRPKRAQHYVEKEIEWWTLLFFMLLFSIAGGLSITGVTDNLATQLTKLITGGPGAMTPFVIALSSVGSAFIDNIVFVAAFTPIIESLIERSSEFSILWWALLFGACFGGNITAIGSTANIVALGLLEKKGHACVTFLEWLKIGAIIGLLTGVIAWIMLSVMSVPMPRQPLHNNANTSYQPIPVVQNTPCIH